jgi:meiotically up-regulated gene 157 (Mug157) protein
MLYCTTAHRIRNDGTSFHGSRRIRSSTLMISSVVVMIALFLCNIFFSNLPEIKQNNLEMALYQLPLSSANYKKKLLPASVWATRELPSRKVNITHLLLENETSRALELCEKFVYSSLRSAVQVEEGAEHVYVSTGDIDSMWTRDSVVQMSIYLNKMHNNPWLRFLVEGVLRRNAFNIIQDPYANAYNHWWRNPERLELRDQVIGRGGFVATRNFELDSGAYFLCHLYDYYRSKGIYRPEALLEEPKVFEAVMLLIDTWIVEQHHEELSPYRYFELPREGKGVPTVYTGMIWAGFRPSDDACKYGYLIPANIHAVAGLERLLVLNERVWKSSELETKVSKLLREVEDGIRNHGVFRMGSGELVYAYEVDGMEGVLREYDDANVPSLLSIPLLGWSGYDKRIYQATRKYLLSTSNRYYYEGEALKGIGSRHTPSQYVWPMALIVQGLTEDGDDIESNMAFQMKQLLTTACNDSMHESVSVKDPCSEFTRKWFEWVSKMTDVYLY